MKIIGYIRVSTDRQGADGLGMEAQKAAITAYAQTQGMPAHIHSDVVSGATDIEKRPGLMAAIDDVKKGDVFVVVKRDRIGRDVVLVAMIERLIGRKGGKVISIAGEGNGNSPSDQLMKTMIDAFAAYERQIIGVRTKAALEIKKAQGKRYSNAIPYGKKLADDGMQLVDSSKEKEIIALVTHLKNKGISYSEIGRELERRGYIPRGKKWYPQTIKNIILKAA